MTLPITSLICSGPGGDQIVPHYLTERDYPWLRALLDEYSRFVGQRRRQLESRMREPLPVAAPKAKLRVAAQVLDRLSRDRTASVIPPREARWRVFCAASPSDCTRENVLQNVAAELGVSSANLEAALIADLKDEKLVASQP